MAGINSSAAAENPSKKTKVEAPAPNKEEDDDQVVGDELELGDDNDPFEKLADETMVEILVRVNDEKSLRRCIALNKRMSGLVPLADPISIHIPPYPIWVSDPNLKPHYNIEIPGSHKFSASCTYLIYDLPPLMDEIVQYYIKTASEYLRRVRAPIQHVTVKLPPLDKTVFGLNNYWCWNLEYSGAAGRLINFILLDGDNIDIEYPIETITHCMRFGAILRPMVE